MSDKYPKELPVLVETGYKIKREANWHISKGNTYFICPAVHGMLEIELASAEVAKNIKGVSY